MDGAPSRPTDATAQQLISSNGDERAFGHSPHLWGRWPAGQRGVISSLFVALLALLTTATLAHASSLGLGNVEPGAGPPSGFVMQFMPWFEPVLQFIQGKQQEFYRALTAALKAMRADGWQVWWLVGISFLYGVFHAAGPGHGKAVISSYMIANETELKRGVLISFLSAFVQGGVAILVTTAGFLILRGSTITMTDASRWLEIASFALIMAFGLYLLYRKLRGIVLRPVTSFAPAGPELVVAGGPSFREGADRGHSHGPGLNHIHAHKPGEVCAVCGHAHAPSPEMVAGEKFSLSDAWTAIVAVGLRPCSGAIFVLTFSFLNGLYLGGVLSVIGMSLGTAITVAILATIAVTAKDAAIRFSGSRSLWIGNALEIAGAVAVILFGFTFLMASLQG